MGKSLNLRSDKGWRKERGGCILSVSLPEGWGEVDADTRRSKSSASKLGSFCRPRGFRGNVDLYEHYHEATV